MHVSDRTTSFVLFILNQNNLFDDIVVLNINGSQQRKLTTSYEPNWLKKTYKSASFMSKAI